MSVIFEANIKLNEQSDWYIELIDTVDGRKEICNDIEEFSKSIEKLGEDYGGRIDEVKWSKDDNLSSEQFEEINSKMRAYQEELDK